MAMFMWNHETLTLVKSFEVTEVPGKAISTCWCSYSQKISQFEYWGVLHCIVLMLMFEFLI